MWLVKKKILGLYVSDKLTIHNLLQQNWDQKNYEIIYDVRTTICLFIENSFRTMHYFASANNLWS